MKISLKHLIMLGTVAFATTQSNLARAQERNPLKPDQEKAINDVNAACAEAEKAAQKLVDDGKLDVAASVLRGVIARFALTQEAPFSSSSKYQLALIELKRGNGQVAYDLLLSITETYSTNDSPMTLEIARLASGAPLEPAGFDPLSYIERGFQRPGWLDNQDLPVPKTREEAIAFVKLARGTERVATGRLKLAREDYLEAEKVMPNQPLAVYYAAMVLSESKRYPEASDRYLWVAQNAHGNLAKEAAREYARIKDKPAG